MYKYIDFFVQPMACLEWQLAEEKLRSEAGLEMILNKLEKVEVVEKALKRKHLSYQRHWSKDSLKNNFMNTTWIIPEKYRSDFIFKKIKSLDDAFSIKGEPSPVLFRCSWWYYQEKNSRSVWKASSVTIRCMLESWRF